MDKQSLYYIWLHNESEKISNTHKNFLITINILLLFIVGLNINKYIFFCVISFNYIILYINIQVYIKNKIRHNIAKIQYNYFLNEINQELIFSYKELEYFLLFKKLEFDKLNKCHPSIPNNILAKFKKKFKFNNLYTTKPYHNLYERILLIKSFQKLKRNYMISIKNKISYMPFENIGRPFFNFQNVKLRQNHLEIKIRG